MTDTNIDTSATDPVDTLVTDKTVETAGTKPEVASLLTGDGKQAVDDKTAVVPADWPEDWRAKLAGGDEKILKRFERYQSPKAVAEALLAAQQKISSGELKTAKPEKATPEQLTEWRKANGIPETPDKYDTSLPNGLVIGEADKPIVDEVLKAAHEADASPAVVKNVLSAYYKAQDVMQAQQAEQDADFKEETESALRAEWGPDYRRNLNQIESFLGSLPEGLGQRLAFARLSDGRPLGADPVAARWLADLAREANPLASVMDNTGDKAKGLTEEIDGLKAMMGNRTSEYWKGPNAEKHQARYRELITIKERFDKKNNAA
jgi:hypothetical protein